MNIRVSVVVLLVLSCACGGSQPISPTTPPPPPQTPAPAPEPQITFPPSAGPSRLFVFEREATYPVRDFTKESRIILYDNGAFELQYLTVQGGLLRGAYQDAGGLLMFLFEGQGRTVGTPWNDATATLESDLLTLTYSESMQHSDFEDAVYRLIPPG